MSHRDDSISHSIALAEDTPFNLNTGGLVIREAGLRDIPGITAIYNAAIRDTTAIWSDTQVDTDERERWMLDRQNKGFPVVVALDDVERVTGYATYGPYNAREGYRLTVEHSVYVAERFQKKGIGTALLKSIIGRARDNGMHAMIGAIEASNTASITLHEKLGFEQVGFMREVGVKFGRYLDLITMQKLLD